MCVFIKMIVRNCLVWFVCVCDFFRDRICSLHVVGFRKKNNIDIIIKLRFLLQPDGKLLAFHIKIFLKLKLKSNETQSNLIIFD